jgi:hypothetical protein
MHQIIPHGFAEYNENAVGDCAQDFKYSTKHKVAVRKNKPIVNTQSGD